MKWLTMEKAEAVLKLGLVGGLLRGFSMIIPAVVGGWGYPILLTLTANAVLLNTLFAFLLSVKLPRFTVIHAGFVGFLASGAWNIYVVFYSPLPYVPLAMNFVSRFYGALVPGALEGFALNALAWWGLGVLKIVRSK